MYSDIKTLIEKYDQNTHKAAAEILRILKKSCETYKEVKKDLDKIEKSIDYELGDKYTLLFQNVRNLLEEEMSSLPLTNRS